MELEFNYETLIDYQKAVVSAVCQEETLESIVPDACPDILNILDVYGQAILTGKQARKGIAEVEGTIKAVILYQPESGTGLRNKAGRFLRLLCLQQRCGRSENDGPWAGL